MGNRIVTLNIFSNEEIPERLKMEYHGFLPGRHTAKNLFKWMESEWLRKSAPPTETAKEVMKETDLETAIAFLVNLFQTENSDREEVAWLLGQIDPSNEIAIGYLVKAIQGYPNSLDSEFLIEKADRLWQLAPDNETVISTLVQYILDETIYIDIVLPAAKSLAKFDPGNKAVITYLYDWIQTEKKGYNLWIAAESLGIIDFGNQTAINTLLQLIEGTQDRYLRCQALLLNRCDETSSIDISELCQFKTACIAVAESLGKIYPGNETAISTLVELIHPTQEEYIQDDSIRVQAAYSLGRIDPGNEMAISTLVDVIQTQEDEYTISAAINRLREVGKGNELAINALIKLIQNGWDEDELVAETLGKIDPGNEIAITTLVKLILDGGEEAEIAADSLERILQGAQYPKVVTALKNYMIDEVFKHPGYYMFYQSCPCHDVLWRCAQNMSYPDFYRAWHSEPSSIQSTEDQATDITS